MKYAVEMDSGVMIYIPSFIKIGSGIQRLRGDTQTHRLMGGIYEVLRWDELRCHDIHTEFHKDWFRHSKVDMGIHRQTDGRDL
jgi:hypothetical protein